jgi:CelD/BcsL family acetyltransferase involved in cellulose biosynthesis
MKSAIDIDPVSDPRWEDLASGGGSTLFNSTRWLDAVSSCYGFEARASVLVEGGRLTSGLAYAIIDDVRGHRVVAFPFSDFCEPIAPDLESWRATVDPLLDLGPLTLRCREGLPPTLDGTFHRSAGHLWHSISIDHRIDDDTRFSQLHAQVRQNIRRARRADVKVTIGSESDHVRRFYDLHVSTRLGKHRLLPQPFQFFERLHEVFADDLLVALAEHEGLPIAGILFIASGDSLYYKYNASDVTADLTARPNELLIWEGIRLAVERRLGSIDLGVSSVGQPDLIRYKRKLADEERPVVSMSHRMGSRAPGPGLDALLTSVEALVRSEGVDPDVARRVGQVVNGRALEEADASDVDALLGALTDALIGEDLDPVVAERAGRLLYRYFA